ncbi:ATP-binding protein [Halarcobacter sp.]|uniref:ATP-binding protein n=1 Tax=Halarcobacter sp. TaxID=2321133 RepID=UPI0029F479C3|nr:ATP-binding protein [Halarcobacter sp.]
MLKNKFILNFLFFTLISLIIYSISTIYINKEERKQLSEKYQNISNNLKTTVSTLITDKKNATLAMAMSIAKDKKIAEALLSKSNIHVDYKNFSLELRETTRFKNVWFQIIDKDGNSFYRSWTDKSADSLRFRKDVQEVIKNKKILASISVGRFDMTFKSMVPIFHNNEFLGIFEVITHFNSISKVLENNKIDSLVLANKRFKDKITYPFSNKFLDDYYIANLGAKKSFIDLVEKEGIENILSLKNYKIVDNNILTHFEIVEFGKNLIGHVILSINLNNVNIHDIKKFKRNSQAYVFLFIFLFALLYTIVSYYIYSKSIKKLNNELENNLEKIKTQEKKNQIILDSQKNIIVITDGYYIKNSNKQLLNFFNFKSLEKFKEKYECICQTFVDMNDKYYLIDKDYNGKNWAEHILANPDKKFKAAIKKDGILRHFTLNVNSTIFDEEEIPYIIVTLTDITQEIEQQKKLKNLNGNLELLVENKTKELKELNESLEKRVIEESEKNKEKDRMLFQQNKMAAMGEMLSNIAHQWRQPLASISAAISSLKLQKELGIVDNNNFNTTCDLILKNSSYLSQTIEDFKNFFKKDREKCNFLLKKSIAENITLLKEKLKHDQIQVLVDIDDTIELFGYKNEFQQAILNIINNSIDALNSKDDIKIKIIKIDYANKILSITDSARGIKKEILTRIFEPYFTTKHQSQGTGIGLYMTREILTKHMGFNIDVENIDFEYNNEILHGASFKIHL